MTDTIKSKIKAIIAEQTMLEPDQLTDDSTPADMGIDSLGLVEAIFALEEEFDISVPFNANEPDASDFDISNLGSIIAGVKRLVAEKAA